MRLQKQNKLELSEDLTIALLQCYQMRKTQTVMDLHPLSPVSMIHPLIVNVYTNFQVSGFHSS